jgi:hypothetical protein
MELSGFRATARLRVLGRSARRGMTLLAESMHRRVIAAHNLPRFRSRLAVISASLTSGLSPDRVNEVASGRQLSQRRQHGFYVGQVRQDSISASVADARGSPEAGVDVEVDEWAIGQRIASRGAEPPK